MLSLAINDRVYNSSVSTILLFVCKIWIFQVEDVPHHFVPDLCCLQRIADIRWQHRVSSAEVLDRVLRFSDPIGVTILKYRLRWPFRILQVSF